MNILYRGFLLLSLTTLFTAPASAEIYKWVDADGNVHFGDKPKDQALAREAQPVELSEGYQPAVRTAQEQEAYDKEQRAIQLRNEMHRREAQQAEDAAQQARSEQKAALCAKFDADINALDTVERENGVRVRYYVKGEDGRSVSTERQQQIVEELKAKRAQAGCD